MSPDKAYEVLGVKPGVSMQELKAAHRDLAKVWHPDRFQHDPRLQKKAQEKLKEINEAYEQISSGKIPRPVTPPARQAQRVQYEKTTTSRKGFNWQRAALALLVFAAVFAITTRSLLQRRSQPLPEEPQVEDSANVDHAQSARPDQDTRAEVRNASSQKSNSENEVSEVAQPASGPTEPAPAVETVTVTIDPETGLLAKPECRLKSRMTYPSGSQPTGYCNLSHTPPPKESRIKSIAKSVKRTLD